MSATRELRVPGNETPTEKEYRAIADAMARCTPNVATFDARPYAPHALQAIREVWRARMIAEYRSTSVFSGLAAQAMEAGASLDSVAVILRLAQDEIRHAEGCGRVLAALGDTAPVESPREVAPLAVHPGCSAQERALRNVVYGCAMSEIVNCARFVDVLDTMSDPYLRDATRQLLADERLHGQFGFHYLEDWRGWLEAHPDAVTSLTRYLRHAFAVLEKQLSGTGAPPREMTDDLIALGFPDPQRLPASFYATVEQAIVPGLERFGIEAGMAWRERRLGG